jgi:hypothetical protein
MKEEVFAGRPYGCEATSDINSLNCKRIGYCSANPDVYCLVDDTLFPASSPFYLAKQSCGSFGTCQPLWNIINEKDEKLKAQLNSGANGILEKLFLQAPIAYKFGPNGYQSTVGYFSSSNEGINPNLDILGLYYGASFVKVGEGNGVKGGKNYRLEFTSAVDKDHQPLKQLVINWGDGYNQVITDQDSRPSSNNPHIFYHYYSTDIKPLRITIKAYDNWGRERIETRSF